MNEIENPQPKKSDFQNRDPLENEVPEVAETRRVVSQLQVQKEIVAKALERLVVLSREAKQFDNDLLAELQEILDESFGYKVRFKAVSNGTQDSRGQTNLTAALSDLGNELRAFFSSHTLNGLPQSQIMEEAKGILSDIKAEDDALTDQKMHGGSLV